MNRSHNVHRHVLTLFATLAVLLLTTNVAFAKNRVNRTNQPRVHRLAQKKVNPRHPIRRQGNRPRVNRKQRANPKKRIARKPRQKKRFRRVKRNVRKRRSVKRNLKRNFRKKSNRKARNVKRARHRNRRVNYRRRHRVPYNIFKNTSWRHFKITKNSTRINHRVPRMKLMTTFPNVYKGGRWPQSLNVDKKGHYAYIGFDSFANDGSKLLRYNLYRHHFNGTSRTFSAGHAQAVSVDKNGDLWFINRKSNDEGGDHQGPINKGFFVEVSPRSLKPIYNKAFKFGRNYMGDNLAFAGKYGVFNLSRIWGRDHTSNHYRRHMLVIYHTNQLNRRGSQWTHLAALRNTPGTYTIQAVAFNPKNRRLYVASSLPTYIISMPVIKLFKHDLKRHDVQVSSLRIGRREIEGLSFDSHGYMYLLLGSPGQLLRSRRPVTK